MVPRGGSTSYDLDGKLSSPINSLAEVRNLLSAPASAPTSVPKAGVMPFLNQPANNAFVGNADWVFLPYCTQDFHSGNRTEPVSYDFSQVHSLVNEIQSRLNASGCATKRADLEASYHIDIEAAGACPHANVTRVSIDIYHEGAVNFAHAWPMIKDRLAGNGFDLRRADVLVAGSSAGGFGAWYNAWRIGDDIQRYRHARLTIAPMSGSPTTRLWDESAGDIVSNDAQLAQMKNRLSEQGVKLPCEIRGGAYRSREHDRCYDNLELARHYRHRWPDLDLRIVPVINKEDMIGVGGFAGLLGSPDFGPKLLQFCRTVQAYGQHAARIPYVHPWIGWLWERFDGNPRRVHGFARADQLVPLASPNGRPGYAPGDGAHGVLAYINGIASRDPATERLPPMIEYQLALVEDPSDPVTGLDTRFEGDWATVGIDPSSCDVAIPLHVAGVKKQKRSGAARLKVDVPAFGKLKLARTQSVVGVGRAVKPGSMARLRVRPRGVAKRRLRRRGHTTVRARIAFKPASGDRSTKSKRIRIVRARKR